MLLNYTYTKIRGTILRWGETSHMFRHTTCRGGHAYRQRTFWWTTHKIIIFSTSFINSKIRRHPSVHWKSKVSIKRRRVWLYRTFAKHCCLCKYTWNRWRRAEYETCYFTATSCRNCWSCAAAASTDWFPVASALTWTPPLQLGSSCCSLSELFPCVHVCAEKHKCQLDIRGIRLFFDGKGNNYITRHSWLLLLIAVLRPIHTRWIIKFFPSSLQIWN